MAEVVKTLVPMFIILLAGFAAGYLKRFSSGTDFLNTLIYYVSLPAFIYTIIIGSELPDSYPWQMWLIAGVFPVAYGFAHYFITRSLTRKHKDDAASAALSASYGNVGYIGVPLTLALLGPQSAVPITIASLLHNLTFLIGYPMIRQASPAGEGSKSAFGGHLKRAVFTTLTNPVALATAAGIAVLAWEIPIPDFVNEPMTLMGDTAVPLSLFAVGMAMHPALAGLKDGGVSPWMLTGSALSKLVVFPLGTWVLTLLFGAGLDPMWAGVMIMLAATPSSTTTYILSDRFDKTPRLAAGVLSATTLGSIVTIPLIAGLTL